MAWIPLVIIQNYPNYVKQFWNITRGIYTKYHCKSCYSYTNISNTRNSDSSDRAVFKWLSKVITWLRFLRLVIGLKDSRQFFNQWEAKPKPIAPCTRDISRASGEFQVIASVLVFRQSFENRSIQMKWVEKQDASRGFFNQLRSVLISDETLFRLFDIASQSITNCCRNSKQKCTKFYDN